MHSQCRVAHKQPVCSCQQNFIGSPPNCRPECVQNSECHSNLACVNFKCKSPCEGLCGVNAECSVIRHRGICQCVLKYTGDPFTQCLPVPRKTFLKSRESLKSQLSDQFLVFEPVEMKTPCFPNPCGANAVCKDKNGAGSCSCISEYHGDPYTICRPECSQNSDCDRSKACFNQKCQDPCPGVCGNNALCDVVNHSPSCECLPGFTGNSMSGCRILPKSKMF